MSLFQDIIDKVKNKKKVDVKEHLRKIPGGLTRVDHYSRFIDNEKENITDETSKEIKIDEVDDELKSVNEDDILNDIEEEPDEEIKLTKGEIEVLPKVEPHELPTLIKNWQDHKDEESLLRILNNYDRFLRFHANKFKTSPIPYNLILLEAKRWLIKAVETYNPNKKAAFNTHLTNYLRKLFRFVSVNQNIAKIPEQRILKINNYKSAATQLEDKLGREPSDAELADELSWSVKEVQRLRNELGRAEILNFGKDYSFSDLGIESDKISKALKIIYYDGSKEERFIMEHTTNLFGKKQYNILDLANKLKISESKVKSIMSNINKKVMEIA